MQHWKARFILVNQFILQKWFTSSTLLRLGLFSEDKNLKLLSMTSHGFQAEIFLTSPMTYFFPTGRNTSSVQIHSFHWWNVGRQMHISDIIGQASVNENIFCEWCSNNCQITVQAWHTQTNKTDQKPKCDTHQLTPHTQTIRLPQHTQTSRKLLWIAQPFCVACGGGLRNPQPLTSNSLAVIETI